MNYLSPFSLLDTGEKLPPPEQIPQLVRRARKHRLVDAELSGTGFFVFRDTHFSKDEVLALLDELQDEQLYRLHRKVCEQNNFRRFLETGQPAFFYWKAIKGEPEDKAFTRFIQPYFVRRLVAEHVSALRSNDAARMWALREIRIPRKDAVLDELYDKLLDVIYHRLEDFRHAAEELEKAESPAVLEELISPDFVNTWNALPSDLEGVRDDLAELFVRFFRIVSERSPGHYLLGQLAENAQRLSCGRTGKISQARLQRLYQEQLERQQAHGAMAEQVGEPVSAGKKQNKMPGRKFFKRPRTASEWLLTVVSLGLISGLGYVFLFHLFS